MNLIFTVKFFHSNKIQFVCAFVLVSSCLHIK